MIDKEDRRWLFVTTLIFLVITSLPYLLGYYRQGADWRFTGFILGVEDGNSYIAKMLSGTYGSWLFRSPYTAIPQQGTFAFFPYILIGKLASNPEVHDQLVVIYQIFRWLSGGLLAFAVLQFSNLFIYERKFRRIATVLILLGGGIGWLGWLAFPSNWTGRLPLEVYSPEAFGFLSLLGLPHLAMARALLLLGFVAFLKEAEGKNSFRSAINGGVFWLAAGFFQPLTIVVGYGILGFYFLLQVFLYPLKGWRERLPLFKKFVIMALIPSPWVFYNYISFASDPYLKIWYAQNIISSPPLQDYVWSYGLFFIAAIPAIIRIFMEKKRVDMLLVAWLVCAASLAYFPYNLQRRFIEGVWIALIILVVSGYEYFAKEKFAFIFRTVLTISTIAPILVMMIVFQGTWLVSVPIYRPTAEIAMFEVVNKVTKPGDVALASYETGNVFPAWAPVHVLAGHGPESAYLIDIRPEISAFFSGAKDMEWQKEMLSRFAVQYIISGPPERALGNWEAVYGSKFILIYQQQEYKIYKVEDLDGK